MIISLLVPCYVDLYRPQIGMRVVELLERLGHRVDYPEAFTCCGQPPFNSGCTKEALPVAARVLDQYADAEAVVVPSGSCATMLRVFYPQLFQSQPERWRQAVDLAKKTWEFSEFLVTQLHVENLNARYVARAAFHDGCHGLRELGIQEAPRQLLRQVQGLQLVEMDEAEACCGFGGTFAVKFPHISTAMAEVKAASLTRAHVDTVISNDPSCLMQLEGYLKYHGSTVRCLHLAEVLASR